MTITLRPAAFIDRDGVLNEPVDRGPDNMVGGKRKRWTIPYRHSELRFKPSIHDALELLRQKGYLRIVVSNQSSLALGLIEQSEFDRMQEATRSLPVDDVFVCTHLPDAGCNCRKPAPGMLFQAGRTYGIDFSRSFMVGDHETDIQAGKAAGTKTILVTSHVYVTSGADRRVMSLMEAAEFIPRL